LKPPVGVTEASSEEFKIGFLSGMNRSCLLNNKSKVISNLKNFKTDIIFSCFEKSSHYKKYSNASALGKQNKIFTDLRRNSNILNGQDTFEPIKQETSGMEENNRLLTQTCEINNFTYYQDKDEQYPNMDQTQVIKSSAYFETNEEPDSETTQFCETNIYDNQEIKKKLSTSMAPSYVIHSSTHFDTDKKSDMDSLQPCGIYQSYQPISI